MVYSWRSSLIMMIKENFNFTRNLIFPVTLIAHISLERFFVYDLKNRCH